MNYSPPTATAQPEASDRLFMFAAGLASSVFVALQLFRPYGLPVAYLIVVALGAWALFRPSHLQPRDKKIIAAFLSLTIYATAISVINGTLFGYQTVVRSISGLFLFFILLRSMRSINDLPWFALGMAPLMALNAILGAGQLFGSRLAFSITDMLITTDVILAGMEGVSEKGLRIYGSMHKSHSYAYVMSLASCLYGGIWLAVRRMSFHRSVLMLVMMGACALATMMTAQRTAAWPMTLILLTMMFYSPHFGRLARPMLGILFICGLAYFFLMLNENFVVIQRLTILSGESQTKRQYTWRIAMMLISEDPYFGTSFRYYNEELAIHSGYFRGWLQFGLPWLVGFLVTWGYLIYQPMTSTRNMQLRAAALAPVGLVLANMTSHTLLPTYNDMQFWPFLAVGLFMLRFAPEAATANLAALPSNAAAPAWSPGLAAPPARGIA